MAAAAALRRLSASCCSALTSPPLFRRPPTYPSTVSHIRKWKQWAKTLTLSVGSSFAALDNGPDATLLCRELNWLLDDVVVHQQDDTSLLPILDHPHPDDSKPVFLRASLDDLCLMWNQRIHQRRPFQYIVGCQHWRDLVLCVQEGVLIPRPETELIVDLVGDVIREHSDLKDGIWADLGTGSGALAIGIGRILANGGKVVATDLSSVAAAVASYNVQRYNLQDKIEIRQGSWFEPLKDCQQKLAGLVSNPPYIPSHHIAGLQAEVGMHEPRLALDGGSEGMDYLFHLCNEAASMLKPGGFFALETNGKEHCQLLADYLRNGLKGSFSEIKIVSDFADIPRFVTGFRSVPK
uniref:Methyltransferase small domain-containing protein n=1 Tax=Kalanchoe fedtschenkoi TaxID=63787 RepID=A0A7N0URK1_KALFE